MRARLGFLVLAALAVAACAPAPDPPAAGATPPVATPELPPVSDEPFASEDEYRLLRTQAVEALDAAASTGAESADACRVLLYGDQACGGPTDWVVFSAETSDTLQVRQLAERVTALSAKANAQFNYVSTCMALIEPPVMLNDGQCVAQGDR